MSDDEAPPEELAKTLSAFADRLFHTGGSDPGNEAIDVPGPRMAVYRELVTRGYRSMLRFAFTNTFRIIVHDAKTGIAPEEGVDAVVQTFLETSPPATHSTREMARRFHDFLPGGFPELFVRHPALAGLLDLEEAEVRAMYHDEDPGRTPGPGELHALATGPVEAFLSTTVIRAPSATFLRLREPSATLHHQVSHRRFGPVDGGPEVATVTRHPETLESAVRTFEDPGARALEALPAGEPVRLEDAAAQWLDRLPEEDRAQGQDVLFTAFARALVQGMESGFVRLAT